MNREPTTRKPGTSAPSTLSMATAVNPEEQSGGMQIDGFAQVLEMLKIADRDFRESLLRRIAARDRQLAINLIKELGL
ncbi:MAG: hypothetical protein AAB425_11135 [Bdellovibrionota bacterium]